MVDRGGPVRVSACDRNSVSALYEKRPLVFSFTPGFYRGGGGKVRGEIRRLEGFNLHFEQAERRDAELN